MDLQVAVMLFLFMNVIIGFGFLYFRFTRMSQQNPKHKKLS